jgi:signal recognition particle subunit SRP54
LDLTDLLAQLRQAKKMGGIAKLADKLPRELAEKIRAANPDDSRAVKMEAAILSMTPRERRHPEILKASRKRRVAAGAGVPVQVINQLLRELEQAQKIMKRGMQAPGAMRGMFGA